LGWRLACEGFSGLSRATIPWQKGKGDDTTVCGEENNAPGNAVSFIYWNLSTKKTFKFNMRADLSKFFSQSWQTTSQTWQTTAFQILHNLATCVIAPKKPTQ
jgi:hypothetical protein